MNVFVADPHWGWWIIWYFYLGGIAAGSYFLATLADLFAREHDRTTMRAGFLLAAPLIAICGALLIVDLSYPERFWHMMLDPDTWLPHGKVWSPMSIGAWAVLLFSVVSTVSFFRALAQYGWWPQSKAAKWLLRFHRGFAGRLFDLVAVSAGFFVAAYTGVLLTATNQPFWSDSPWIATLFLASSAGTGLAAIRLADLWIAKRSLGTVTESSELHDRSSAESGRRDPIDAMEVSFWSLELVAAALLLVSLDGEVLRELADWSVAAPFGAALILGVMAPWMAHVRRVRVRRGSQAFAAVSVLVGGFLLRYAVLKAPPSMLRQYDDRQNSVARPLEDFLERTTSNPRRP